MGSEFDYTQQNLVGGQNYVFAHFFLNFLDLTFCCRFVQKKLLSALEQVLVGHGLFTFSPLATPTVEGSVYQVIKRRSGAPLNYVLVGKWRAMELGFSINKANVITQTIYSTGNSTETLLFQLQIPNIPSVDQMPLLVANNEKYIHKQT